MPFCRPAIALIILVALMRPGFTQSFREDAEPSREEWRARILEQRERFKQMRREGRRFAVEPPSQEQLAAERLRQAFNDPGLMPGDIIVTPRGHYVYRGGPADRERMPEDFVLLRR
jgi:hypothetical protein